MSARTAMIGRPADATAFMVEDEDLMAAGASALVQKLNRFLPLQVDELARVSARPRWLRAAPAGP